jgi:large subunit ribosomal protein L1
MAKAKTPIDNVSTEAAEQITDNERLDVVEEKLETSAEADSPKEDVTEDKAEKEGTATAKSGKRSAKALKEAEEEQAKEERKLSKAESEEEVASKPKQTAKPTRPRVERQGKKFREVAKLVEKDKAYTLAEAIELAQKTNPAKFDASVELHINLGVDPRQADQNIRDNLVLPAGTGKKVRVAVFADVGDAAAAKKAGADVTGNEEFLQQLDKGTLNFDILIATPAMMPRLGKYARVLGPRGLMPNPKSGTVVGGGDIAKAVGEAKAGRVEYRVDTTGIVHLAVGKVSFKKDDLTTNIQAVLTSIKSNKPASVKGNYIKAVHLTTSMGPSITVAVSEI